MPSGYDALRHSAAWFDLSARGRIYASGEDRARLLHAMTTNHVQQLTPGGGCYAFFLNAQGHILADVDLLCLDGRFLLDTEPETRERVFRHLDKYIIADDVTLEDASAELSCLAVEGPQADALLSSLGAPQLTAAYSHAPWERAIAARISATGQPGTRLLVPASAKATWILRLESAGAIAATPGEVRTVRLENGKPRYGEDIFETTLPQETHLMHGVHFAKGCYIGQEIVERIRSRGHVNKLLFQLGIEGTEPLPRGMTVIAGSTDAGEITSSVYSPALAQVVALAYLRAQLAATQPLHVDGRSATVLQNVGEPALHVTEK